jgi:hypothetical protein
MQDGYLHTEEASFCISRHLRGRGRLEVDMTSQEESRVRRVLSDLYYASSEGEGLAKQWEEWAHEAETNQNKWISAEAKAKKAEYCRKIAGVHAMTAMHLGGIADAIAGAINAGALDALEDIFGAVYGVRD